MKKFPLIASLTVVATLTGFSKDLNLLERARHEGHQLCKLVSSGISEPSHIPTRNYHTHDGELHLHTLDTPVSPLDVPKLESAVFNFTFDDAVSDGTRAATIRAGEIWSQILTTNQTINVFVFEEADEDENSNTLASAYAYDRIPDGADSYLPAHLDPVVISNRKYGVDWTPGLPDIVVNVNANQDFYYGTDGNCPEDKHDLVSILLHEIGHGLGFFDSISADPNLLEESTAAYGFNSGLAFAYDHFLVDGWGNSIIEGVEAQTDDAGLYTSVTSGSLYFGGPLVKAVAGPNGAKIYAPLRYSDGSSISHLDESTYLVGNANSLMTPTASLGEVIHDPGPIGVALLGDLGWDNVWIDHTEVADTEDMITPIQFAVSVRADNSLESVPVLYYRPQGAIDQNFRALPMAAGLVPGQFSIPLQLTGVPAKYEYYIAVPASSNRVFTYPAAGADAPLVVNTGPDDVAPTVVHTPQAYHYSHRHIVNVTVDATDNISMGGVTIDVWLDSIYVGNFAATPTENGKWSASFGIPDMTGKTAIQYRVKAYDASAAQNTATFPAEGFYTLPIEQIYPTATAYVNDLDTSGSNDFILDGFEVKTLEGFTSASLGTIHPYLNNGDQIDFYAYLRQPIVVQAGMKMTFDEIVLVEPGEAGTSFGDDEFWDYVTVEISKDRGRTWLPLTNGWDSSSNIAWETAYNDGIPEGEQDSETVGTADMFRSRTILFDESENVGPGDEIMLRFYLFSDPYAVGWGWEIDNIVIGQ